jgi:hypothetical protein
MYTLLIHLHYINMFYLIETILPTLSRTAESRLSQRRAPRGQFPQRLQRPSPRHLLRPITYC